MQRVLENFEFFQNVIFHAFQFKWARSEKRGKIFLKNSKFNFSSLRQPIAMILLPHERVLLKLLFNA